LRILTVEGIVDDDSIDETLSIVDNVDVSVVDNVEVVWDLTVVVVDDDVDVDDDDDDDDVNVVVVVVDLTVFEAKLLVFTVDDVVGEVCLVVVVGTVDVVDNDVYENRLRTTHSIWISQTNNGCSSALKTTIVACLSRNATKFVIIASCTCVVGLRKTSKTHARNIEGSKHKSHKTILFIALQIFNKDC
jgi:hypothetical protein